MDIPTTDQFLAIVIMRSHMLKFKKMFQCRCAALDHQSQPVSGKQVPGNKDTMNFETIHKMVKAGAFPGVDVSLFEDEAASEKLLDE